MSADSPESTWIAERRMPIAIAATVIVVAAVAALCTHLLHHACTHDSLGEPIAPEPGTQEAGYCLAIDKHDSWTFLAVLPTLLVAAAGIVYRKRPRIWLMAAAAALLIVIAMTATAPLLPHGPTT